MILSSLLEWSANNLPNTDDISSSINSGTLYKIQDKQWSMNQVSHQINRKLSSLRRYASFA
jgi:hypothetical protein